MLVRAKLENKSLVVGFVNVPADTQIIEHGGAFFVYSDTNERIKDGVRMVQRVFQIVSGPVLVIDQLEQEF